MLEFRSNLHTLLLVLSIVVILAACGWAFAAGEPEPQLALSFSTYLDGGRGGTLRDIGFDSSGNVVVVGHGGFSLRKFPEANVFGALDDSNIIVAKLSSDGSKLLWVSLIGGINEGGRDRGYGLVVGPEDCVYVAGRTSSTDFPTTPGAYDRTHNGGHSAPGSPHGPTDGYALKLSGDGKTLVYSTFLGGRRDDGFRGGLTVDGQGFAYLCGMTCSGDYLDLDSAKVNKFHGGYSDGTLTKLSPDGSEVVWARFLGSSTDRKGEELPLGAKVDSEGNVYAILNIWGTDAFTTADAYDRTFSGGDTDLYFVKVSSDGRRLLYATYFGGSASEFAEHGVEMDGDGNVYVVGSTLSWDFPAINANDPKLGGGSDGFLVKFDHAGQPVFSTYIGGSGDESAFGPALDGNGNIFVSGPTGSRDFPFVGNAYDRTYNGGEKDAYLQIYNSSGEVISSGLVGGSAIDYSRFVAVDASGKPVIAGEVTSSDYPTTPGSYDPNFNGGGDVFVTKFGLSTEGL